MAEAIEELAANVRGTHGYTNRDRGEFVVEARRRRSPAEDVLALLRAKP
jgi:hypothetical protein